MSVSQGIQFRHELADLCNQRGLDGVGAELGTHQGTFAGSFLFRWQGKKLYLIDQYLPTRDYAHDRTQDRQIAECSLGGFRDRIQFMPLPTTVAVSQIPEQLDFAYVDAGHLYWEAMADMEAAWSKLRVGGMLAGHDYDFRAISVCHAVHAFAAKYGLHIQITQDTGEPWSWYCFKEERHAASSDGSGRAPGELAGATSA